VTPTNPLAGVTVAWPVLLSTLIVTLVIAGSTAPA